MRVRVFLATMALAAVCLPAATLERLSLDEMIEKSTEIIRGRVSSLGVTQRGSVIYTIARVQVSERWKGRNQSVVEVSVPGGTMGGFRQLFPGSPQLREGYEYLLFLWTGRSGVTQVIGLSQGLFDLKLDPKGESVAYRTAITETMLDKTGRPVSDESMQLSLRDLRERVRRTLAAKE